VYAWASESVYPHSLEVAECLDGLVWEATPVVSNSSILGVDLCPFHLGGLLGLMEGKSQAPMSCSTPGHCPKRHVTNLAHITWGEALEPLKVKSCPMGLKVRDEYKKAVDAHQKRKVFA
jgi:hypothetical protein